MRASRELVRVTRALRAAGVRALALKGPALAARLGDDPDSRPVADLDLLVARHEVPQAARVLETLGLQPRPRSNGLIREIHFVRAAPPLCVDLHWHVAPAHLSFPIDFEELWQEHGTVEVHGEPVDLPSDVWQLLLAAFYCLKEPPLIEHRYFCDLVRLADLLPAEAWQAVHEQAVRLRAVRIVAVAVRAAFARAGRTPPGPFVAAFPEDATIRAAVAGVLKLADDPRAAQKQRILTYFTHFFVHGRYREHWFDRLRPVLLFPLFLVLPEDDDVERAARSGRWPVVERLLRVAEVAAALRAGRRARRLERQFEALLAEPGARIRPALDVELHILEDRGLLFAPHAAELYGLSTAATWLWCALEEGFTLGELDAAFAANFGLAPEEAADSVRRLLRHWWRAGLLDPAPRHRSKEPPDDPGSKPAAAAPPPSHPALACRLELLGSAYDLRFADQALARQVMPRLADWISGRQEGAAIPVRIFEAHGQWLVDIAGTVAGGAVDVGELVSQLRTALIDDAAERHGFDLFLHAAMLVRDGAAILLPAAADLPRTGLALALVRQGFACVSAENVLLSGDPLFATGVPASAVMVQAAPEFAGRPEAAMAVAAGGRQARLQMYRDAPLPVQLLVFPQHQPGAAVATTRLHPADTLAALLRDCAAAEVRLDAARVERLVRWVREVPAFRLEFGEPGEAGREVAALLELAGAAG